ncbi:uroporphyrinogen-III C-methyltransferase [Peribacillus muralis]|uniref:uroporphyrinogen-III C-methyltransferase n=1 Tax=Peribacillus muralis TaxID=264697 RepID=UPI001F4EBA12|nr:uroporphyrinogen-III C-methyltransferase [Peribacillus muralis]MCK1993481.1 uroporphyrinogen-III C-methyltransferase [Peribacillus muralis]MCK2014231.1 uroporphyrinogen-III C-methyltransferase [Peribacillus muralis]
MEKGKVYIVGAGPGDPDLITIKATKCIAKADVILYDRLVNRELLLYGKTEAEYIYCGKAPGKHCVSQEDIHSLLISNSLEGKTIVRLKGGDPFIFGRGGEEAEVLVNHGIQFEIVPGITAGIAAPAYAGIPVTHREWGSSFAIVTGHGVTGKPDNINWNHLVHGVDTLAIYMGIKNLPYICEQLRSCGKKPESAIAVIEQGTTGFQRTFTGTIDTIAAIVKREQITNPAMIIIGEVVNLSENLSWFPEKVNDRQFTR